jgi:cytochrome c553
LSKAAFAALILCVLAKSAGAQDALRGKRIYLDGGRKNGAGISCVDCHGGMPGALHGITKAANRPSAIEYALGAIPQMAPLRDRLTNGDIEDLSAYLAHPDVASPRVGISTEGPPANRYNPERLEFLGATGVSSQVSTIRISNTGEMPIRLLSSPAMGGLQAENFLISFTDCEMGRTLTPRSSCRIDISFRATDSIQRHAATLSVKHDWIEDAVTFALLGQIAPAPRKQ